MPPAGAGAPAASGAPRPRPPALPPGRTGTREVRLAVLEAGDGGHLAHVRSRSGPGLDQPLGRQDLQRVLGGGLTDPVAGHDPVAGGDPCSRRQHAVAGSAPAGLPVPGDRPGRYRHPSGHCGRRDGRGRAPMTNLHGLRWPADRAPPGHFRRAVRQSAGDMATRRCPGLSAPPSARGPGPATSAGGLGDQVPRLRRISARAAVRGTIVPPGREVLGSEAMGRR